MRHDELTIFTSAAIKGASAAITITSATITVASVIVKGSIATNKGAGATITIASAGITIGCAAELDAGAMVKHSIAAIQCPSAADAMAAAADQGMYATGKSGPAAIGDEQKEGISGLDILGDIITDLQRGDTAFVTGRDQSALSTVGKLSFATVLNCGEAAPYRALM